MREPSVRYYTRSKKNNGAMFAQAPALERKLDVAAVEERVERVAGVPGEGLTSVIARPSSRVFGSKLIFHRHL